MKVRFADVQIVRVTRRGLFHQPIELAEKTFTKVHTKKPQAFATAATVDAFTDARRAHK